MKKNIEKVYSLSPMQFGMLYHTIKDKDSDFYLDQFSYDIRGEIDSRLLEKSYNILIQRYDILRTVFVYEKIEKPCQVVLKEISAKVSFEDISHYREEEKEGFLAEYKRKDRDNKFKLTKGMLSRISLVKREESLYTLIISMHHIITDGWSMGILLKELFQIYSSLENGSTIDLKPVVPYNKYIEWINNQDNDEGIQYWTEYLEGYEEQATLPKFKQSGNDTAYELETYDFRIEENVINSVEEQSKRYKVTLNTFFQAIWGILLMRYNNSEDVVFGSIVSGRPAEIAGVENMAGLFINNIPVRIKLDGSETFSQLLGDIQNKSIASKSYEYLSLADIQANSELKSNLLDHILAFENLPMDGVQVDMGGSELRIENVEFYEKTNYDLNIYIFPGKALQIRFLYNSLVYDRLIIENIERHLQEIIKQVVDNPEIDIKAINILSAEEKQQVLFDFNQTETAYARDKTIHEIFEEQAKRTPDNIAAAFKDKQLSYRELNERANQLSWTLREKGIKSGSIVGLMVERSIEMLTGIYAILKAGGAYIPIDPSYPEDRVSYMLSHSNVEIMVTQKELMGEIKYDGRIIDVKDDEIYSENISNLDVINKPDDLAYVIYTSGSTGKPKGVMITHRNVNNFNLGIISEIDFSPEKSILGLTTVSFDIFVLETLLSLSAGLKIIIADEIEQRDPEPLRDLIIKNNIDMLQMTPSRLQLLMASDENLTCLEGVKELMVGGEAFPDAIFRRLQKDYKGRLYNMYGPTETTVWSAVKDLTGEDEITIGTPLANQQLYILDDQNRLQPIGVAGELFIGGDGLGEGYFGNKELTDEKFIPSPFEEGKKIYAAGDLARWLPNGEVEFFGRTDFQVKIRGFRIELEEIETQLLKHDEIKEAIVMAREAGNSEKYLCAYVVSNNYPGVAELREHLSKDLPDYMVPSYFVEVDSMPLTPNGKINRKVLPEPDEEINVGVEYAAPRNDVEKKMEGIWKEVLALNQDIGINDNFYELGGHSLLVVRCLQKMNKELNVDIPLSAFMKNPTISEVSGLVNPVIDNQQNTATDKQMFLIKEGEGESQNCFFIHQGFGIIDSYFQLCKKLNPQLTCWGILPDKDYITHNSVTMEELAEDYIKKIRAIQPEGPYNICGFCLGGTIAFEIGRQLEAAGCEVSSLIIISATAPEKGIWERLNVYNVMQEIMSDLKEDYISIKGAVAKMPPGIVGINDLVTKDKETFIKELMFTKNLQDARDNYFPKTKIKTEMIFIKPNAVNINEAIWMNYCENFARYHCLEGGHFEIMAEPIVEKTASIFNSVLASKPTIAATPVSGSLNVTSGGIEHIIHDSSSH